MPDNVDHRKTHKRPDRVYLMHDQALIENKIAVQMLNSPSRQLLKHWRDYSSFPRSYFMDGKYWIVCESLRTWLIKQGIEVINHE